MVQVEFLTFQNQVMNKRANALQKKTNKKKYKKNTNVCSSYLGV